MTANQIAYARLKEDIRKNKAGEDITQRGQDLTYSANIQNLGEIKRHNFAQELETNRSNVAKETENIRSNQAKELETNRHNVRTESLEYSSQQLEGAKSAGKILTDTLKAVLGLKGVL